MNYELELPDTPPSLNRFGSVGGGSKWPYIKAKKKWEGLLGVALMQQRVPRHLLKVSATARLRFPDRRKRDEGNFRFLLEKALGDILVKGGWLQDDTPDAYTFGGLSFEDDRGDRRTVVLLDVEGGHGPS